MMDWLYGELDPDQAQDVSRHLDDCSRCHAELSALERTRELFRDVPAEEPPAAVSAMLIREAASRAPAAAKEPSRESGGGGFGGWLSGLFRPLMHPAAAALATLVLVAGVAGTLYLKQGEEHFAESETASTPASSERAAAPPAEPTVGAAADESASEGSELALEQEPARQADILETERQSELRKEKPKQPRKADVKPRLDRKKNKRRSPPPPPKSVVANAVSGGDVATDSAGGFVEGESDRAQQRSYRSYRENPGAGLDAWAKNKQVELTRAYKDEDCLRAAKIANDILDRHPEFFSEQTRNLEAVKRCRPYVTKERTRRSVARAKRSGSGGGKKAGKAAEKAAPMRDEALAEPAESQ